PGMACSVHLPAHRPRAADPVSWVPGIEERTSVCRDCFCSYANEASCGENSCLGRCTHPAKRGPWRLISPRFSGVQECPPECGFSPGANSTRRGPNSPYRTIPREEPAFGATTFITPPIPRCLARTPLHVG